jgi:hypothetical protein
MGRVVSDADEALGPAVKIARIRLGFSFALGVLFRKRLFVAHQARHGVHTSQNQMGPVTIIFILKYSISKIIIFLKSYVLKKFTVSEMIYVRIFGSVRLASSAPAKNIFLSIINQQQLICQSTIFLFENKSTPPGGTNRAFVRTV